MSNEAQEAAAALLQAFAMFKFTPSKPLNNGMLAGFGRSFGLRHNAVEDGIQYLLDNNLLVRDGEVDLFLTELGCEKMREAVDEASRSAAARRKARGTTVPDEIRRKRDELAVVAYNYFNWCDDDDLNDENMPGAGPGGDINPFGWYVVGSTSGGNGVVVRADDPGVFFADHEWCGDGTAEGTRRELILLAPSIEEFRRNVVEIQAHLDKIA
jgi:hypothetical protein